MYLKENNITQQLMFSFRCQRNVPYRRIDGRKTEMIFTVALRHLQ